MYSSGKIMSYMASDVQNSVFQPMKQDSQVRHESVTFRNTLHRTPLRAGKH